MATPDAPLKIFIGYDSRQAVAYNVLQHSITARTSQRVSIEPLILDNLPITRMGLTPFTFSRFLVPWLCYFEGPALFMDADMLCLGDVAELFALADDSHAVQVVKTQERFEWASMALFNCGHPDNRQLTPEFVETAKVPLHKIGWTESIGELPAEWNHTVLYDKPRPDAKIIHFTAGIPLHPETRGCEYTDRWIEEATDMNSTLVWEALMGVSVHSTRVRQLQIRKKVEACVDGSGSKSSENKAG